jgi:hypothetical protein
MQENAPSNDLLCLLNRGGAIGIVDTFGAVFQWRMT